MMWHGVGVHGYGVFLSLFWMVLVWGAIITALIWFGKSIARSEMKSKEDDERRSEALVVLDRRYAEGEIDQATYKEMKLDLKS